MPADGQDIQQKESRVSETWNRWVMQTAKTWADVSSVIKETGIEAIDYDHRRMTEAVLEINNLLELIEGGGLQMESIRQQERVLENLYAYASRHFARELRLIKKYNLPCLKEQIAAHKEFLTMLNGMIQDFREGRLTASNSIRTVILDWWIRHINELDYISFCSENWTAAVIKNATDWKDLVHLLRRTGVDSLDNEHREMTVHALQLVNDLEQTPDPIEMDMIFGLLVDIAAHHFQEEETFIDQYNLPGLNLQRQHHADFLDMLNQKREDVASGRSTAIAEIRFEILHKWIDHVNEVDYMSFSLDKHAAKILAATKNWEQASEFIKKNDLPEVNDDHQKIALLIIGLDTVIADAASGKDNWQGRATDQFQILHEACSHHFNREEKIMLDTDYAGFNQHKEQHEKFLNTWKKRAEDIASGRAIPTDKTKHALLEWWVQHIREFDMKAFSDRRELADWSKAKDKGAP